MSKVFTEIQNSAQKFWNSKYFIISLVAIGVAGLITDANLASMFVLIAVLVFLIFFCDDLLSISLPLLLIFLLSTKYYKDLSVLTAYMWYAIIPVAVGIIFNLIYYRKPTANGKMLYPLLAISAALVLGGAGNISKEDYFRPLALYYVIGLGFFMLFIYCLSLSRLQNERDYDRGERLAKIMYAVGIFAVLVVIAFCLRNLDRIIAKGAMIFYKPRNYLSSVLLMSMPMVCLFVKRNNLHLISIAFMYVGLVLTGSRSGLLFGTFLVAVCGAYIYISNKEKRKTYNIIILALALPVIYILVKYIPEFYSSRVVNGSFISSDETRVKFIKLGIEDFLSAPLFGVGMGNQKNIGIFPGIFPGCLVFYHNVVVQLFGALGLFGTAAYGWLFVKRVKLLNELRKTDYMCFGISYFAIILMSFTNPGIFCPFPEAALLVLMFAIMEKETSKSQGV